MKNLILLFFTLISLFGISQYCGSALSNVTITPTTTPQVTTTYSSGRRAFNFYAESGYEYTFTTVGQTSMDTYLRLYSTGSGGSVLAENDDYYSTQSEITWLCTTSGTYSILVSRWSQNLLGVINTCNTWSSTNVKVKYQKGGGPGTTTVSIGDGDGIGYEVPAFHYYEYGWSQMIYTKSEINTVGNIYKIWFHVSTDYSPTSYTAENQKIYMAHTSLSTFPNTSIKENAQTNYASSNYMLVFNGTITWTRGWVQIDLDVPFPWNNTDNLLIKWENRENTWSASYPNFFYTIKSNTTGYYYQDDSYPTVDGYRDSWRPNIKLAISNEGALPVEMSKFDGINNGVNNHLYWITASEQNTSHFNLQKSRDGETWTTITTLNAAGNSTNQIDYDVTDYDVEPIINYYRLQQYDNDGVYEMFGPISINNLDSKSDKTIIKYINLNGQEIDPSKLKSLDVYIEVYNDGTMRKIIK